MLIDYKLWTSNDNGHRKRMRQYLMLSLLLLALGVSGLYVALASEAPPVIAKIGDSSPPVTLVTVPLALPEPPNAATTALPETSSPALTDTSDYSPAQSNVESAISAPVQPLLSPQPSPEVNVAATNASIPEESAKSANKLLPDTDYQPVTEIAQETWVTHDIKSGDTLAQIFAGIGLSARQLHRIVNSSKTAKRLAKIKPGQKIRIRVGAQDDILALVHEISPIHSLQVRAKGEDFETQVLEREVGHRTTHASGLIDTSLFAGAQKAGLSDRKTMELVNIFGWDIDFALEIRSGDQFTVVYQEDYLDGEKLRDGPILAAEFVNQGKIYRAVRYVSSEGRADYYTPEGKSVRKAFLRTPVKVARVSSRFNLRRKHPVLNRLRAHKGVDYAAPKGTPIRASGDGKISLRGRKGGYGKTVIIEHGGGVSTLYAHMSSYARNKRKGTRVKQGDVIGYIGKTGLATGNHLHYEFRVNGVHRNPLTVKLPAAKPIARNLKPDFDRQIRPIVARLDALSRTMLAKAP